MYEGIWELEKVLAPCSPAPVPRATRNERTTPALARAGRPRVGSTHDTPHGLAGAVCLQLRHVSRGELIELGDPEKLHRAGHLVGEYF